tara:strand:- start:125 stop:604 length:480 start_codon:yes stop_codon:yes gene_type:complete
MKIVKKTLKKTTKFTKNQFTNLTEMFSFENVLGLLFTLFIVLDMNPNMAVSSFFSSSSGYFVLFIGLLASATNFHPIISIIYIIFAFELVKRSNNITEQHVPEFVNGESTRKKIMKETKFFPTSLEETVINEKVPPINYGSNSVEFKDNDEEKIPSSRI